MGEPIWAVEEWRGGGGLTFIFNIKSWYDHILETNPLPLWCFWKYFSCTIVHIHHRHQSSINMHWKITIIPLHWKGHSIIILMIRQVCQKLSFSIIYHTEKFLVSFPTLTKAIFNTYSSRVSVDKRYCLDNLLSAANIPTHMCK